MKYEAADALAAKGDATALDKALIALSFSDRERDWTAAFLLRLMQHEAPNVRRNGLLGVGHMARRLRPLPDRDAAAAAIKAALADPDAFVRGQADVATADLESFLGATITARATAGSGASRACDATARVAAPAPPLTAVARGTST